MYSEILESITYLETYKSLKNTRTLSIEEESLILKKGGYNSKIVEKAINFLYKKSSDTPRLNKFIEKNSNKKKTNSIKLEESVKDLASYIDKTVIPESAKKVVMTNINLIFIMSMSDVLKKEIESRISTIVTTAKLIPALYVLGLSSFLNFQKEAKNSNPDEKDKEPKEKDKKETPEKEVDQQPNQNNKDQKSEPKITKPLPVETQKEKYIRYREQEEQAQLEDLNKLPENFVKMENIWKNVETKYIEFLQVVNNSFDEFENLMPELKSVNSVKQGTQELNSKVANGVSKISGLINSVTNLIKK
jgi:hypothetical protein